MKLRSLFNYIAFLFSLSGVLVNLHHPSSELNEISSSSSSSNQNTFFPTPPSSSSSSNGNSNVGGAVSAVANCGPINVDSIQQVIGAKWAVDVINTQSNVNELKIGEFCSDFRLQCVLCLRAKNVAFQIF